MTINEYVEKFGVKLNWLARQIGVSPNSMSAYARDMYRPSWEAAGLLEVVTNGLVPRTNWYPSELPSIANGPSVTDATPVTQAAE